MSANSGATPLGVRQRQEDPAALLAPLEDAGVGKDLEVARDPRLALAEDLGKLADRQLHDPQQRHDAQPRRVGERLIGLRAEALGHLDKDIKISLYRQFSRMKIIPCP